MTERARSTLRVPTFSRAAASDEVTPPIGGVKAGRCAGRFANFAATIARCDSLRCRRCRFSLLSQARYALAMAPVASQAGNAALGQWAPERFDDRSGASPTYSAIEATVRAPRSIYRAIEGEGNPKAAVRDGCQAVGVLTGLPTGPLVRPLGHLADDQRDEVTLRRLVTGR